MATVITSIGSKSTTGDPVNGQLTMSSSSGSGTPWAGDVVFTSTPTANIGDQLYYDQAYYNCSGGGPGSCSGPANMIYLITGISSDGLTLTVKYISGGANFDPNSLYATSSGASGAKSQPYVLRFYSTPGAWNTALDNASDLYDTGDSAQGELYKDSYYSVTGTINISKGLGQGLVRVGLTVASSQRHDGTAGSGVEFKLASSTVCGYFNLAFQNNLAIRRLLEWVEYNGQTYGQAGCGGAVRFYGGGGYTWFAEANHCLIHNFQWGSTDATGYNNVIDGASAYYCAQNNIIYDHTTESDQDGSLGVIGINCGAAYGLAANNTVHDIRTYNTARDGYGILCADSSTKKVVNNICTSCSDDDFSGAAQGNNNLSSDSTAPGSNSVTGASASDLFENPTRGSEDLHLKNGAEALRAGADLGTGYTIGSDIFGGTTTAITTLNIDIDGRNRDSEGDDWDIGADQCDTCYAYNFAPAFLLFLDN